MLTISRMRTYAVPMHLCVRYVCAYVIWLSVGLFSPTRILYEYFHRYYISLASDSTVILAQNKWKSEFFDISWQIYGQFWKLSCQTNLPICLYFTLPPRRSFVVRSFFHYCTSVPVELNRFVLFLYDIYRKSYDSSYSHSNHSLASHPRLTPSTCLLLVSNIRSYVWIDLIYDVRMHPFYTAVDYSLAYQINKDAQ